MALLATAGCHSRARRPTAKPATVDAEAVEAAASRERMIVATCDAAIARAAVADLPALQVARAVHATHLAALHDAGALPSTSAPSTVAPRRLIPVVRQSASELRGLAIRARSGANAALFASIAASHEVSAVD